MDGTNAGACEKGRRSLPCHWQIDGDCIAFLHAKRLEYVGYTTNLLEKLSVGDSFAVRRLICLVDDSGLDQIKEENMGDVNISNMGNDWHVGHRGRCEIKSGDNEPCQGRHVPNDRHNYNWR